MCHKMGATEHAGHSEDLALQESWAWVQGLNPFLKFHLLSGFLLAGTRKAYEDLRIFLGKAAVVCGSGEGIDRPQLPNCILNPKSMNFRAKTNMCGGSLEGCALCMRH